MTKLTKGYILREPECMDSCSENDSCISFATEMYDNVYKEIVSRTDLLKKSGYKSFNEILRSSAYINVYVNVYSDKSIKLLVCIDDIEQSFSEYIDISSEKEKAALLNAAEIACMNEGNTLDNMINELY